MSNKAFTKGLYWEKKDILLYIGFTLIAGLGLIYGNAIQGQYEFLRVWQFQNVLFLLLGIPFLFLQAKAGIPHFLDSGVTSRQRFLVPALIGAAFGVLDVLVIKVLMHPEPYTSLPPFLQPFPYSLFLYFSGAFELEVFYRLIPITIFLWMGRWFRQGKYFNYFFWAGIILTALREPLEQFPDAGWGFTIYAFSTGFLMNFLQGLFFARSGFLATLTLRLGHYLFWHILLGIYVQYFELGR